MLPGSADNAFRRFRRTGNPGDLSAVFDRTAPELLKLGRHLASTEAAAEDLVQATFLTAIEAADSYDEGQPVLPWLVGILANHARVARRRSQRPVDVARLPPPVTPDPVAAAASEELTSTLKRSIDRLPKSYRQVLQLHLALGLAPSEIARSLARPPGTVRAQISRGLGRLRRALPPGFAAGAASAQVPGRGLEAVRAHVLARCKAPEAAITAAAAGGWTLLHKLAAAAAILSIAALIGYGVYRSLLPGADGSELSAEHAGAGRPPAPAAALSDATTPGRRELPTAESQPTDGTLTVEVLRATGETPAPGVRVTMTGPMPRHQVTDDHGIASFTDVAPGAVRVALDRGGKPARTTVRAGRDEHLKMRLPRGIRIEGVARTRAGHPVNNALVFGRYNSPVGTEVTRTDSAGRFVLNDVRLCYSLHVRAPGHARSANHMVRGEPGTVQQLEFALSGPAHRVSGTVRDAAKQVVAGARVALLSRARPEPAPSGLGGRRYDAMFATTDADGVFTIEDAHAGRHLVLVTVDGRPVGCREADVYPGSPSVDVRLPVSATVEGVVLDHGRPAGGVELAAVLKKPPLDFGYLLNWFGRQSTQSDSEGRYRFDSLMPGRYLVRAMNPNGRRLIKQHLHIREGDHHRWDVSYDAERSLRLRIAADERDYAPPQYWAELAQRDASGKRKVLGAQPADAHGRISFEGLAKNTDYEVLIRVPLDQFFSNSIALVHRGGLRPGGDEVSLEIPPANMPSAYTAGRIVDESGRGIANVRLLMIRRDAPLIGRALGFSSADGAFRIGPVPAGNYSLEVRAPGKDAQQVQLEPLTFGTTTTTGDIRLPNL